MDGQLSAFRMDANPASKSDQVELAELNDWGACKFQPMRINQNQKPVSWNPCLAVCVRSKVTLESVRYQYEIISD